METIALYDIPFTFMKFPLLTKYREYCYDRLAESFDVEAEKNFRQEFHNLANPKIIKFK